MAALNLTIDNFDSEVLKSDKPVLIDFWAPWCGPCQMVLPIIAELAEEVTDAKICKVNVSSKSPCHEYSYPSCCKRRRSSKTRSRS